MSTSLKRHKTALKATVQGLTTQITFNFKKKNVQIIKSGSLHMMTLQWSWPDVNIPS